MNHLKNLFQKDDICHIKTICASKSWCLLLRIVKVGYIKENTEIMDRK